MLQVRLGKKEDITRLNEIYATAREFMRATGNPNQWKNTNPTEEQVLEDIELGRCKVIYDETGIHGVFALCQGEDPTYEYIEGGQWLNNEAYVTIHRIASDQTRRGIFRVAMDECKKYADNIRIDTHKDNAVMQRTLEKYDFQHCGVIYLANGEPREAYQWAKRNIQDKDYSYNTPANVIIKELSARYNVSIAKADTFEKELEKIGFLEITDGDELFHSSSLEFCYLTINTKNGLKSRDRKPFNVVINLKQGMLEEVASAVIVLGISGKGLFTADNKLVSVASVLGAVFSALSLTKINFSENETAILLALQNGSKREEECLQVTNTILREYRYDELSEDAFMRAVNNLDYCRCISITAGILSVNEKIKS